MKIPQIGSIYKVKNQLCYVYKCENIFRIKAITKCENKSGWFQHGNQKEIPLTQEWLDLLKEFSSKCWRDKTECKTLNEYLYSEFDLRNLYDFDVIQEMENSSIRTVAKMKDEVFKRICEVFEKTKKI